MVVQHCEYIWHRWTVYFKIANFALCYTKVYTLKYHILHYVHFTTIHKFKRKSCWVVNDFSLDTGSSWETFSPCNVIQTVSVKKIKLPIYYFKKVMAEEDGVFHRLSKRGLGGENPPNEDYFWKIKQEISSSDCHRRKKLED